MGCEETPEIQALSSAKSEIIQVSETFKEVMWLQPLLIDLGFPHITSASIMLADNEPAAHILLNNPTHSCRTKHMDIKIKVCGELLARKQAIVLKYVPPSTILLTYLQNP